MQWFKINTTWSSLPDPWWWRKLPSCPAAFLPLVGSHPTDLRRMVPLISWVVLLQSRWVGPCSWWASLLLCTPPRVSVSTHKHSEYTYTVSRTLNDIMSYVGIEHSSITAYRQDFDYYYCIVGNVRWVKFSYQALKAYFRSLIFPEHVIIIIIIISLLSRFSWANFSFLGLSVTKIKPDKNFPLYGIYSVIS